jgi:gliding motility-associated-like protein
MAQCTTLGQNPSTAFPVCGTTTFQQATVPICGSSTLYVPGCSGGNTVYQDKNPFWYKFTCFATGTLGFLITPNNLGDDYDWQLYDITGHDPNEVYTNPALVVTGNWSGSYGTTGTSASGVNYIQCASDPTTQQTPTFAIMPTIIAGHNYLLLISHFTDSQSGYGLSFGGGTASITDPKLPHQLSAYAPCDGTLTTIKLNKPMKCSTLSSNGSEFTLSPPIANVIGAVGFGCSAGFDTDSLILTLDNPLPPGNYTITIKNGADANTIADNCDRFIPVGESIPLVIYPIVPTPMDSITKPGCAPDELTLVFKKGIQCSSIAADGSDFIVTGPTPVTVTGATGVCNNGVSRIIKVKLSAPILTKGTYVITLVTGTDGNTLVDECNKETPAGSNLTFYTKDTVNADFTYNILYGCKRDTIAYFHDGRNEVNTWKWNFDGGLRKSTLQNPVIVYGSFGNKTAQLIVSNGVCSDTSAVVTILLDNALKAAFEASNFVCPGDQALFKDNSTGNIVSWNWDFNNGNISTAQTPPPQSFITPFTTTSVIVRLIVQNNLGCKDTATQKIILPNNCYIAVPNAFTPNSDGLNDYLYPLNAYKAVDLLFRVYNRFGQMIFETRDWTRKWDGNYRGQGADPGTYVWILQYTDRDTGKRIEQKGATILIR